MEQISKLEKLKRNVDMVMETKIMKDNDFYLVIDGKTGNGKSMLAKILSCRAMKDKAKLDLMVRDYAEFVNAKAIIKPGEVLWIDEGQKIFLSRKSMTKKVIQAIESVMSDLRGMNILVIICIPNLLNLDKYLKEDQLDEGKGAWIRVDKRGHFMLFSGSTTANYIKKVAASPSKKHVSLPEPDLEGLFEPEYDDFWERYLLKKKENVRTHAKIDLAKLERLPHEFIPFIEAQAKITLATGVTDDIVMNMIYTGELKTKKDDLGNVVVSMASVNEIVARHSRKLKKLII